jgi:hypothetical protein
MSLSPVVSAYADAYTTVPDPRLVVAPQTFYSTILRRHLRKRHRQRAFAKHDRVLVAAAGARVLVPAACTVVGHLCPAELKLEPAPAGGSVCTVDMHAPNVTVFIWTTTGATAVRDSATVRTRSRIAAVTISEAPEKHATICDGRSKAAMTRANEQFDGPGVSVWTAPLPACQYAVLVYDTTVGWECSTCAAAFSTAAALLAHLNLPDKGAVERLQRGTLSKMPVPVFTGPVAAPTRAFSVRAVNPAALRGRLTLLARAGRSRSTTRPPRLTIEPRW